MSRLDKKFATLEYYHVPDDTQTYVGDAVFLEQQFTARVIRHRAKPVVEYLVELPNGERKWVVAT